jgi:[ribosomal protein S18]-alanine N-acetyltransferase
MAVLQRIRQFFIASEIAPEVIISAPATTYTIRPLTVKQLKEVWKLNQRCFGTNESYPKTTLNYLLSASNTLSYRAVTSKDEMAGFIFATVQGGTAHLTTVGVAPEHRRRRLAQMLINHLEESLRQREISMISLEVRVSNFAAQNLYRQLDYAIMQRLVKYYNNGEDGFLMVKSLV